MNLPASITINSTSYFTDGGTMTLHVQSNEGTTQRVTLTQRAFRDMPGFGRLYFDAEAVPVRSDAECELLGLLKTADIDYASRVFPESTERPKSKDSLVFGDDLKAYRDNSAEDIIHKFLEDIISFVELEEYVTLDGDGGPTWHER